MFEFENFLAFDDAFEICWHCWLATGIRDMEKSAALRRASGTRTTSKRFEQKQWVRVFWAVKVKESCDSAIVFFFC